jgi:hypothetical protein
MKIISQRHKITSFYYKREFMDKTNNFGFSFPCDEEGNLKIEPNNTRANENYDDCINGKHPDLIDKGIVKYESSYMKPSVGICDKCGKEVELTDQYCGACQCECGEWYNMFGQHLKPPENWEEPIESEDY